MSQLEKNTVSSKNQLKGNGLVTFINPEGKGKRFMFVGNSITRHGVLESIGWYGDYGMAASGIDKDYVHLLAAKISEICNDAVFCICQVSEWESDFVSGKSKYELFSPARDFCADYIVMRLVENCAVKDSCNEVFRKEYKSLIDYLDGKGSAKVVLTTSFWKHPYDEDIMAVAKERNYPYAYLGDLGELDEMKATGLFEHSGVAAHPGDKGMKAISDRIFDMLGL